MFEGNKMHVQLLHNATSVFVIILLCNKNFCVVNICEKNVCTSSDQIINLKVAITEHTAL